MRQNRHNLLAFPMFNKAMSILSHEAKALLKLFLPLGESDCLDWSNDKDDTGYTWISIKSL